jgi:single-stranded-DNA-specific exonuclease
LNRAFVAQGLKVMARRDNIGMAALIDASRLSRAPTCSDLGFALGPRINAGGRVAVLVLAGKGWHPGVIGIVAGRIKEKTGKPALVIALDADEAGHGKGSGRSIAGVDLGAAIIAAREAGLLVAGGGHAMAAGLTVDGDSLDALAEWLNERLAAAVTRAGAAHAMLLDLALAPGGMVPALVDTLESAGPFGVGWPGPRVAVGPVRLIKADLVGTDHVRLIASGHDGASFKAIAFRAAASELGQALLHGARGRSLWLAGRARIDDWASRPCAELHLEDAAWAD